MMSLTLTAVLSVRVLGASHCKVQVFPQPSKIITVVYSRSAHQSDCQLPDIILHAHHFEAVGAEAVRILLTDRLQMLES